MKKVLTLGVMFVCSVFAMGQGQEIERAVIKTSMRAAENASKVTLNIPLVVPSGVEITGTADKVTSTYLKARKAAERLTPTQRTLLGVKGVSVLSNPEAFGHLLEGVSSADAARMTLSLAGRTRKSDHCQTCGLLKRRDILHAQQYSDHVWNQMFNASKPMDGEPLAKWTVSQLPESKELDFLCIGEENAFMSEGLSVMDNLLTEMRAKYPERDIVMVTSFLPNQTVLFPGNEELVPRDYHNQVWQSALRNNITVVGADVSTMMQNVGYTDLQTGEAELGEVSTAQTAMGQQMQRGYFFNLINEINRANQDRMLATNQEILFVLYGRPVNMLYNGFESVASRLDQQYKRVKVIHIAPASEVDFAGMPTDITTSMEKILPDNLAKLLSQQRAMAWQPPPGRLRKLMHKFSGSDICLKVNRN